MGDTTQLPITTEVVPVQAPGQFDMANTDGIAAALKKAETVVSYMAAKCTGPDYIANIQGKRYPKVTWWTTVGGAMALFPREVSSVKMDREEIAYEAVVEVWNGNQLVSRASSICSATESRWKKADEYAVKSMATTRATGKAYRLAFAFLAVMAGLEPTPAEEMPADDRQEHAPSAPRKVDATVTDSGGRQLPKAMAGVAPIGADAYWLLVDNHSKNGGCLSDVYCETQGKRIAGNKGNVGFLTSIKTEIAAQIEEMKKGTAA